MKNILFKQLATLGFIGYLPAPGTAASIATLPLIYMLKSSNISFYSYLLITALVCLFSYYVIARACKQFASSDPSQIVIDEVAGCFTAYMFTDMNFYNVIAVLLLYRLFDITKAAPICYVEDNCNGAFGILIDDIVAGLIAAVIAALIFL